MNKKISILMVLILYAALAGIPSVMSYLMEKNIIVQSYGVSCGSCHVDPSANTPGKINLTSPSNPKQLNGKELPQPRIDQMGIPQIFNPGIFRGMGVISSMFISSMTTIPEIKSISKNTHVMMVQYPNTTTGMSECIFCHKDPQNLTPHVNGGNLCLNCHGSKVHETHESNQSDDCIPCHGNPPVTPKTLNGAGPGKYIVCEKCHAPPPDSMEPSNGNIINIHMSRGKSCANCHVTEIGHEKSLIKE